MKPITLILLLATAIAISVVVRVRTLRAGRSTLSGASEVTLARSTNLSGGVGQQQSIALHRSLSRHLPMNSSGSSAPPAQSPTNPEAQRIIGELVVAGLTPEEAAQLWNSRATDAGVYRTNRPAFPGTRSGIDTNRWPLFSEP